MQNIQRKDARHYLLYLINRKVISIVFLVLIICIFKTKTYSQRAFSEKIYDVIFEKIKEDKGLSPNLSDVAWVVDTKGVIQVKYIEAKSKNNDSVIYPLCNINDIYLIDTFMFFRESDGNVINKKLTDEEHIVFDGCLCYLYYIQLRKDERLTIDIRFPIYGVILSFYFKIENNEPVFLYRKMYDDIWPYRNTYGFARERAKKIFRERGLDVR